MKHLARLQAVFGALAIAIAGCGGEGNTTVSKMPLPSDASVDSTADVVADAPPDSAPDGPAARRQVFTRNPFGNVDESGNLFYDGDFEWSAGGGQTPWIVLGRSSGDTTLSVVTGGLCRSGLRCASLDNTIDLLGNVVPATGAPTDVSIWAKVPGNDCTVITVYAISAMLMEITDDETIPPLAPAPDTTGWCQYESIRADNNEAMSVYITASGMDDGKTVIVDDGVAKAAPATTSLSHRFGPVKAQDQAKLLKAAAWMRQHRSAIEPQRSWRAYWPWDNPIKPEP